MVFHVTKTGNCSSARDCCCCFRLPNEKKLEREDDELEVVEEPWVWTDGVDELRDEEGEDEAGAEGCGARSRLIAAGFAGCSDCC